jgi:hypothetical protein
MSRTKLLVVLLVLGALLAVPLLASAAAPSAMGPLTITLAELNNSGESGTAVLTDLGGGQTKVDVTVKGEPADGSHPMHIHTGQCGPTLGPVVYPLTNVVGGTSTTTIAATLDSLMDGNHAVNVHKSKAEIGTYVACGNIPKAAPTTAPATGGNPYTLATIAFVMGILALGAGLFVRRLAR